MKNKILIVLTFLFMAFIPFKAKALENEAASVNDVIYETLQDAVSNAKEGEIIKVLKDLDLTDIDWYVFVLPDNSTLDLNGHSIKSNSFTIIYAGKNITIKNGTFTTDQNYSFYLGDEVDTDNVVIEDLKFIGGLNIYNATNVVIRNVDVVTGVKYYDVWADQHAQVTIESGTFKSTNGSAVLGVVKNDAFIKVKGGKYITQNDNLIVKGNYATPEIYGGVFNTDPSAYVVEGPKVNKNETGEFVVGYEKEVEVEPVDSSKTPQEVEIGVSDTTEAKDILKDALEKENILSNTKVVINETKKEVTEEEATLIQNKILELNKDAKITDYFDITINIINTDNDEVIKSITNLDKKLKFSILLPEKLQNTDDSIKRTYYIVRNHENKVEILDAFLASDGKSISFESDKFSTYAIAYADIKVANEDIENPKTADGIFGYLVINTISMIAFVGGVLYINKKKLIK